MKIANLADLHAGAIDLKTWRRQWDAAMAEVIRNNVQLVTIAGDVFDAESVGIARKHYRTGDVVDAVKAPIIWALEQRPALEFVLIPGNHDFNTDGSTDALATLDGIGGVTILREIGWESVKGFSIFALPWRYTGRSAEEIMQEALDDDGFGGNIFLAHVQVNGAKMNTNRVCESSGRWTLSRATLDRIAERFERVVLGDFHHRHDLTGNGGYVGALCQNNFGEENNLAGFEIFDTMSETVEWITLHEAPTHATFEVEAAKDFDLLGLDAMRALNVKSRVIISGFEPDREIVNRLEAAGVQVIQEIPAVERVSRVSDIPDNITNDPEALMRLYSENQSTPWTEEEMKRRIELCHGIMSNKLPPPSVGEYDHVGPDGAVTPDFLGEVVS